MEVLRESLRSLEKGNNVILITVVESRGNTPADLGKKMIVSSNSRSSGTIGGGGLERKAEQHARRMLETRSATDFQAAELHSYNLNELDMTCGGSVTLLYERFKGKMFFVLFGGGHVGSAVAPILESLGYTVVIFDNRQEIIQSHTEEHGSSRTRIAVHCSYEDISDCKPYLQSGMCFIASHNHEYDTVILKQLLEHRDIEYTYIGMIGSRNKVKSAFEELNRQGLTVPASVYAPVGLAIGGGTPEEIAVSIASEIIAIGYGKEVPHMRR